MSLKVACDMTARFGAIRDQGSRVTCVAFAVSDVHAVARGAFAPLSVEHLYYHAVRRAPGRNPSKGVSLPTILSALRLDGQATEAGWPYLDPLPHDLSAWKPPKSAVPVYRREHDVGGVTLKTITAELNNKRPVVITFRMTESFFTPINGFVSAGNPGADADYHAVIAVGYGQNGGNDVVLVRNSWGANWGIGGYGWVEAGYLVPRLHGVAMMGDEAVS